MVPKKLGRYIARDKKKTIIPGSKCLDKGLVDRYLPRFRVFRP